MNSTENTTSNNKIKNLEKSIIALDAIGKKYEEVLEKFCPLSWSDRVERIIARWYGYVKEWLFEPSKGKLSDRIIQLRQDRIEHIIKPETNVYSLTGIISSIFTEHIKEYIAIMLISATSTYLYLRITSANAKLPLS